MSSPATSVSTSRRTFPPAVMPGELAGDDPASPDGTDPEDCGGRSEVHAMATPAATTQGMTRRHAATGGRRHDDDDVDMGSTFEGDRVGVKGRWAQENRLQAMEPVRAS